MVGRPCHPWGRLGFDQWWYPLLHTEPSFLQKYIRKKKSYQKNIYINKQKKRKLLNYVMTWSLSRVRRQLSIFLLSSVTHSKKIFTKKKKKKKRKKKRNKKKIQKKNTKKNHTKKKRKQKKTRIIRKEIIKKKIIKKKICWTTWWLDSSSGYVGSLVLVTEF